MYHIHQRSFNITFRIKRFYPINVIVQVVVCTDLSGNEVHSNVIMGMVVISGCLGDPLVSTLAWNVRDVGLIPALGTIFPIFVTPTTLGAMTMTQY